MAVKLVYTKKPEFSVDMFTPGLLIAGPCSLFAGILKAANHHHSFASLTGGTVMLILGLVLLKLRQDRLEKRLDELERLKN